MANGMVSPTTNHVNVLILYATAVAESGLV